MTFFLSQLGSLLFLVSHMALIFLLLVNIVATRTNLLYSCRAMLPAENTLCRARI